MGGSSNACDYNYFSQACYWGILFIIFYTGILLVRMEYNISNWTQYRNIDLSWQCFFKFLLHVFTESTCVQFKTREEILVK